MKDKGLAWDMCKLKITAFSVPFVSKRKKKEQNFERNLKNNYKNLKVV